MDEEDLCASDVHVTFTSSDIEENISDALKCFEHYKCIHTVHHTHTLHYKFLIRRRYLFFN